MPSQRQLRVSELIKRKLADLIIRMDFFDSNISTSSISISDPNSFFNGIAVGWALFKGLDITLNSFSKIAAFFKILFFSFLIELS